MSGIQKTFSESWHRVANLRVSLLPTVDVKKQFFRGEEWYILNDPVNNNYFRIRPEAYSFIARLNPKTTVENVWNDCLNQFPDTAPGQEDVIQLLTQLYNANLLYFQSRPDTRQIFERHKKREKRELQSKFLSVLFMRIPLFDPDNILNRFRFLIHIMISPLGAIVWLLVVGGAIKTCLDQLPDIQNQMQGILSPDNIIFLYFALCVIKTLHEIAHAIVCKRFGGEVHTLGVMLLVFTPLPYMDATSSWTFRNRWHRLLVGAAGILTEVFLAAIAAFIWSKTGQGTLHSLAYNVMFIASISTVLFNANPLLRFDGYYILSDFLDIPNLHTQSKLYLQFLMERYIFGSHQAEHPTQSIYESFVLIVFGVLSFLYRMVIFAGIILFVADKFLIIGLLMAVIGIITWGIVPMMTSLTYILTNPKLQRSRVRVLIVTTFIVGSVILLVLFIPFPDNIRAPGVIEAKHYSEVFNDIPGYIQEIFIPAGTYVNEGDRLLIIQNREMDFDLASAKSQQKETLAMIKQARNERAADLQPLTKRLEQIDAEIDDLKNRMALLTIRSRHAGIWQPADDSRFIGRWMNRGSYLGEIIDPNAFIFSAAVPQEEAARLFQGEIKKTSVKIKGQALYEASVTTYQVIPYEQSKLPSMAIGWRGGGQIATSFDDSTGLITREPFFLIIASLTSTNAISLIHGRSGRICMQFPPKPLYFQFYRSIKQLLQKRYQL